MKHSLLLSKARKSAGVTKTLKRRRPSKKLVTTLEGLEDALPELEEQMVKPKTGQSAKSGFKSLGSKPGVRRKREKIEREERETKTTLTHHLLLLVVVSEDEGCDATFSCCCSRITSASQ